MTRPELVAAFLAYVKETFARRTYDSYESRLTLFLKLTKDKDWNAPTILEYRAKLSKRGLQESTVCTSLKPVAAFFRWAVDMEYLPKNPMPKIRYQIATQPGVSITAAEMEGLIAEATIDKNLRFPNWPNAMRVAWHTGLRISDVAYLKTNALDVKESAIRTIPHKTRKFMRMVEIPVPPDLITALLQHADREYVFPEMAKSYDLKGHTDVTVEFSRLVRRAGLKVEFRSFRRSFITRHLQAGVPLAMVSQMTGINPNQLMTYFKPTLATKREVMGLCQKREQVA